MDKVTIWNYDQSLLLSDIESREHWWFLTWAISGVDLICGSKPPKKYITLNESKICKVRPCPMEILRKRETHREIVFFAKSLVREV